MNQKDTLKILQLLYTGILADVVKALDKYGIMEEVINNNLVEQKLAAALRIEQFNLKTVKDIFNLHSKLFGYANWKIKPFGEELILFNKSCKLRDIANEIRTVKPCNLCCINPLAALCEALKNPYKVRVLKTMWDKDECVLKVISK